MTTATDRRAAEPCDDDHLLKARRKALADPITEEMLPLRSMGLALSGGGIRSATISLGLVQALSRHNRLLDFDYLSTVSGGGYLGSFLSSLFVPESQRGAGKRKPAGGDLSSARIQAFVHKVLSEDARTEQMTDPFAKEPDTTKAIRSPVWWLREHSRYLASNGPTDYWTAISYLSRNWLAMLYTFMVAATAIFFFALAVEWFSGLGVRSVAILSRVSFESFIPSPLWLLPPVCLALTVAAGIAYWLTVSLQVTNPTPGAKAAPWSSGRIAVYAGMPLLIAVLLWWLDSWRFLPDWAFPWLRSGVFPPAPSRWHEILIAVVITGFGSGLFVASRSGPGNAIDGHPACQFVLQTLLVLIVIAFCGHLVSDAQVDGWRLFLFWPAPFPWPPVVLGLELGLLGVLFGAAAALFTVLRADAADGFTNEVRRRLTKFSTWSNRGLLLGTVLATIDTMAIWLAEPGHIHKPAAAISTAAIPALAWLLGKAPGWFAGGRIASFLGDYISVIALLIGALLFGVIALFADVMVHAISWSASPWSKAGNEGLALLPFVSIGAIASILFVTVGLFTGFINLSSLHALYAARLTRAYIGASNIARLRAAVTPGGSTITESHPDDFIDISRYQNVTNGAPLHLINVTLNETRSATHSQLVDRDRKGVPVVFAPEGVYVDAARAAAAREPWFFAWRKLHRNGVESLSVGQLCAISGAAVSSGMGAHTSLGSALALTFANIRLGYWWDVRALLPQAKLHDASRYEQVMSFITAPLRTYVYLWHEMTATYSRMYQRVYLSDGGHFENSGAYELLRRGVRLVLVCDNAEDPDFSFEDLENLTRKARIDLGRMVTVTPASEVRDLVGPEGTPIFLNCGQLDWRAAARADHGAGFALMLNVARSVPALDGAPDSEGVARIIWLKPRLFSGPPPDVEIYGQRNPPFPQQTTGDQFFNEAQWESYRAIGQMMGDLLLKVTKEGDNLLSRLVPKPPVVDPKAGTVSYTYQGNAGGPADQRGAGC